MHIHSAPASPVGAARRCLAATAAILGTIIWTHALAGPLRASVGVTADALAPASGLITLSAIITALAGSVSATWPRRALSVSIVASLCVAGISGSTPAAFVPSLALVPVGLGFSWFSLWLAARLPAVFDLQAAAKPRWGVAWLVLALISVGQVGRLATHMSDPHSDWFLATRDPIYAKHECSNAYIYAAELDRRGEVNIYNQAHYPGLTPKAHAETQMVGMVPEDPFQYPPPFLLLPRLAISLTHDYAALRSLWFGMNFTLCLGAVLGLAAWVRGRVGRIAGLLTPAVLVSFPVLANFQYGQFHFAAVALAVLAMLAFQRKRAAVGGMLLACSILAKLFPALLLIPLAIQRRWRALGWTVAFGAALSTAAFAVFGAEPFIAFATYQLPRLSDGRAFAFADAWPDFADIFVAANQGVFGLVNKLAWASVPGIDTQFARGVAQLYTILLVPLAVWVGLRVGRRRADAVGAWLGLLGLGSLASMGAWADYVPLTCVWLLVYLAPSAKRRWVAVSLGVCALFQMTLLGTTPIGDVWSSSWMLPLSFVGALAMLATFFSALHRLRLRFNGSEIAETQNPVAPIDSADGQEAPSF